MNFEEYINVIKNVNSDIFILLLMFLLEKKPFSNYSIQLHSLTFESPNIHVSATPTLFPEQFLRMYGFLQHHGLKGLHRKNS